MKFGVRYEQSWATACDPKATFGIAHQSCQSSEVHGGSYNGV